MNTSSFEHIVRIQFNALMMTVIKCTVKSRNRQFAKRSKRGVSEKRRKKSIFGNGEKFSTSLIQHSFTGKNKTKSTGQ